MSATRRFLKERVTPGLVILSLVAVAGMLLVIYQPGGVGSPIGVLLTVAGVACCAVYTIITRRWISTSDSTAQVVVSQQVYALAIAFALVTVAWVLGGGVRTEAVTAIGAQRPRLDRRVLVLPDSDLWCGRRRPAPRRAT